MSRYLLTQTAEDELREILGYIREEAGEDRALGVLDRFVEAFDLLADSPNMGFHRPQLTGSELRWWPVFSYLVIYDPDSAPLTVLRVVHGSRDLVRLFDR